MGEHERRFEVFGCTARILVGAPSGQSAASPKLAALSGEVQLRDLHRNLTRFDPRSELARLNADPEATVAVSPTLLAFLDAARWAFERSGGLVDATVIDAVEDSGYRETLTADRSACDLGPALASGPLRRPALPRAQSPWDSIEIDVAAGAITRPRGVRFDSGGITKGHAADVLARRLRRFGSFAVDCGGDVRLGGTDGAPRTVEVIDPFEAEVAGCFDLVDGAVATSGIGRRLWAADGGFSHHLIDPGRGVPAWTGLVQVTALAPSALEAEVLAKAGLLSGPSGVERWLGRWGGAIFDEAGSLTAFGPLRRRLRPASVLEAA